MSKFGNLPEIVKYTEFGRESFALPVGARSPEHHTGANDEPLLHLVIVAPVLDPLDPEHKNFLNIVGTTRENELVKIIHDVAHESHEFTPDQLKDIISKTGVTVSQAYPGGKIPGGTWRELSSVELSALLQEADGREGVLADKAAAAQKTADEEKRQAQEAAAKAIPPAPVDDITREALIRNKQEELKTGIKAWQNQSTPPAVAAPEKPSTPETPKVEPEPEGGAGSGTIN